MNRPVLDFSLSKSGGSNGPECSIVACIGSGKANLVQSERYDVLLLGGTKEEGEITLDRAY